MKLAMRVMCILLGVIICTTMVGGPLIVSASIGTIDSEDQQILSTATIDDNFADDRLSLFLRTKIVLSLQITRLNLFRK